MKKEDQIKKNVALYISIWNLKRSTPLPSPQIIVQKGVWLLEFKNLPQDINFSKLHMNCNIFGKFLFPSSKDGSWKQQLPFLNHMNLAVFYFSSKFWNLIQPYF